MPRREQCECQKFCLEIESNPVLSGAVVPARRESMCEDCRWTAQNCKNSVTVEVLHCYELESVALSHQRVTPTLAGFSRRVVLESLESTKPAAPR